VVGVLVVRIVRPVCSISLRSARLWLALAWILSLFSSYCVDSSARSRTFTRVSSKSFSQSLYNGWRLQSLASPEGGFNYFYPNSASGLVTGVSLPNGATITNGYDSLARLTGTALVNHWGHVLDGYIYTPDYLGLRTAEQREFGMTTNSVSIGYDNIGQLTSWTAIEGVSGGGGAPRLNEQQAFSYDAADNLHIRDNGALVQTFTVDSFNELTNVASSGTLTVIGALTAPATNVTVNTLPAATYGDLTFARTNIPLTAGTFTTVASGVAGTTNTSFTASLPAATRLTYDTNGNLAYDGTRRFAYDASDRMTDVYLTNVWRENYQYDGFDRMRILRQYSWVAGAWSKTNEVHYNYDGYKIIQERDTTSTPLVTYTRGLDVSGSLGGANGIGGLLARTDANGSTYYHSDGSGNVTALMDGNENIVARYLYGPFGKPLGQWGKLGNANTMRFSSMPVDTVSGLSVFPARFYEPNLQRWLNRDPIGENGGINLYAYIGNSPMNGVDPNGSIVLSLTFLTLDLWGTLKNIANGTASVSDGAWLALDLAAVGVDLLTAGTAGDALELAREGAEAAEVTAKALEGVKAFDAADLVLTAAHLGDAAARGLKCNQAAKDATEKAAEEAAETPPVWPKTAEEMNDFLNVQGTSIPDTLSTPGRNKTVWNLGPSKITLEQHPYHPTAPLWHKDPHWHLDTPGNLHQRFLPGDPIPGY